MGAILGYCSLFIFGKIYQLVVGKDGIGGGDFKLLAGIGSWLG